MRKSILFPIFLLLFVISTASLIVFGGCGNPTGGGGGGGGGGGTTLPEMIYVAGTGNAKIYAIDPTTEVIVATIELSAGANPDWLAITPDGKKLFCTDGTSIVYIINTVLNTVEATLEVTSPNKIAITPNGAIAAVVSSGVKLIDTATDVDVGYDIDGSVSVIDIHPTNNKISGCYGDLVKMATPEADAAFTAVTTLSAAGPYDIVVSPTGNKLFITASNKLFVFNISGTDGSLSASATVDSSFAAFYRMDISPDGNHLYVALECQSGIDHYDVAYPTSLELITFPAGDPYNTCNDVALNGDASKAYVVSANINKWYVINLSTKTAEAISLPPSTNPKSIIYRH